MYTFCNSSSSSYACVVYLRTEGKDGLNIQLLQAKSRVAPLRKTTVPSLELLACCIGARLAYSMREAMTLEDVSCFFWMDSMTILYWIKNKENCGIIESNAIEDAKIVRRKDDESFIYPIVLPTNHLLVERLIFENHTNFCHSGTQVVLSNIRQQFWILRGRKTVQRAINQCIRCKIYSSKEIKTVPAPLPQDRVRDVLVFEVTGMYLAGPLYLKNGYKAWIVLFTCAVYRAIHLELIQSLSTDGFLLGLRKIYSDNETNFIGANNLMASLDWKKITQETSILRIQWSFNPPSASWWKGFG
ncbi:integrase catalytic domain-containing protein [Trichonephila clavipes]|nr:integrase catalytic domain-containing protein [Trichonephila clavipes]